MSESKKIKCSSKSIDKTVEFMGLEIRLGDVKNPQLKRVIENTAAGGFRFRYDDHSRKSHKEYGCYTDRKRKYHEVVYDEYHNRHHRGPG